ncbi:ABC transporter ATP-binding protein [Consotaella aegiceratis]|uniref:ABC transporter ATP-binding protein n=1 Tax=Consotaella aegiceratis TaxID=3097961 RepID=UPI002F409F02
MSSLLEIDDLKVYHATPRGLLRAVDGVSLRIGEGEILGLVGESGCGKSTLARCVVGLTNPTAGSLAVDGRSDHAAMNRPARARTIQMIFQDPVSSLNPRHCVGDVLDLAFRMRGLTGRSERQARIDALIRRVGLTPDHLARFPHEMSGGQCQRVGIARALAMEPRLIVCDEPVSALDVSVQAQVLNLFLDLQNSLGLSYLFISHDLSVVRYVSTHIAVMYLGRIVEVGPAEAVWHGHRHPYTRALMSSAPTVDISGERLMLSGDVPSPVSPPSGCAFRTRCPFAEEICASKTPLLAPVASGHLAACHFADRLFARSTSTHHGKEDRHAPQASRRGADRPEPAARY